MDGGSKDLAYVLQHIIDSGFCSTCYVPTLLPVLRHSTFFSALPKGLLRGRPPRGLGEAARRAAWGGGGGGGEGEGRREGGGLEGGHVSILYKASKD